MVNLLSTLCALPFIFAFTEQQVGQALDCLVSHINSNVSRFNFIVLQSFNSLEASVFQVEE